MGVSGLKNMWAKDKKYIETFLKGVDIFNIEHGMPVDYEMKQVLKTMITIAVELAHKKYGDDYTVQNVVECLVVVERMTNPDNAIGIGNIFERLSNNN